KLVRPSARHRGVRGFRSLILRRLPLVDENAFTEGADVEPVGLERIERDRRYLGGAGREGEGAPLALARLAHEDLVLLARRQEDEVVRAAVAAEHRGVLRVGRRGVVPFALGVDRAGLHT